MIRSISSFPRSVVLRLSNRNNQVRHLFLCKLCKIKFWGCVIFYKLRKKIFIQEKREKVIKNG